MRFTLIADVPALCHVTSMSVCCLPTSLDVFRVSRAGALSNVLSFPKNEAEVGPGLKWDFMNHFEFEGVHVVVTRVFPESGASYELVYTPRAGRCQPTPATAKALAAERRKPQVDGE